MPRIDPNKRPLVIAANNFLCEETRRCDAVVQQQLNAIVDNRIVAGGDDHAAVRSDPVALAAFKVDLIRELNTLLKRPDFYEAESWKAATPPLQRYFFSPKKPWSSKKRRIMQRESSRLAVSAASRSRAWS